MKKILALILFLCAFGSLQAQTTQDDVTYEGRLVKTVHIADYDSAETVTVEVGDITLLGVDTVAITTDYISTGGTSDTVTITFTGIIEVPDNSGSPTDMTLTWTTAITEVGATSNAPAQVLRIPSAIVGKLRITVTEKSTASDNNADGTVMITLTPKRPVTPIRWR